MTDEAPPTPTEADEIVARIQANTVAANVRAELARQNLGAVVVADVLHLHRNTVRRRLGGESPFYAYEIAVLAVRLGVTPAQLLGGVAGSSDPGSFGAADPRPLADPA